MGGGGGGGGREQEAPAAGAGRSPCPPTRSWAGAGARRDPGWGLSRGALAASSAPAPGPRGQSRGAGRLGGDCESQRQHEEEVARTDAPEADSPKAPWLAPGLDCVLQWPPGHSGTRRESKPGAPLPAPGPGRAPGPGPRTSCRLHRGQLGREPRQEFIVCAAPAGCWSPGEHSGCCERPSERGVRYHPRQPRRGHPGCLPY